MMRTKTSASAALGVFGALPQQDGRYGGNDHAECEDEHSGPWQGNQGNANNDERQSDAEQDLQHVRIFYRRRGRQRDVHSYAALR
jgi:hypothetical protein